MRSLIPATLILLLTACAQSPDTQKPAKMDSVGSQKLARILADQPDDVRARFNYRHPDKTMAFFGIEPGMTVVEALPGRGWYTKILLPYLGESGSLVGVDYAQDMWPKFGFFDDKFLAAKKTWVADWTKEASQWRDEESASVDAFVFGSMPGKVKGTADAVLFIRALHNLNRFENDGGYLTTALNDAYRALKPGGIVGIVQHRAPDSAADSWADGSRGYLKKDNLIKAMKAAGFEYVAESDINSNPKDQPGAEDIVWRLPPTFMTSRDKPDLKAEFASIGESNRMTLKFRKP